MKRLLATLIAGLLMTGMAAAQPSQNLSSPGAVPGDATYGLERAMESVELGVASAPVIGSAERAAKVRANHAEERLSEAKQLFEENRSEEAADLMNEYEGGMNKSIGLAKQANNTELSDSLENVTKKHVEVLQRVQKQVPEQAKGAIQRAMENAQKAQKGLEKARQARQGKGPGAAGKPDNMTQGQPDDVGQQSDNVTGGQPEDTGGQPSDNTTSGSDSQPDNTTSGGSQSPGGQAP